MAASSIQEVVEGLDVAIERCAEAEEVRMQRRGMREALGHLYSLRAHREAQQDQRAYFAVADAEDDGLVTDGVIFMRGRLAHHITAEVGPGTGLYLGAHLGENLGDPALVWLPEERMPDRLSDVREDSRRQQARFDERRAKYQQYVAGQPVVVTLRTARHFLVESTSLPALDA